MGVIRAVLLVAATAALWVGLYAGLLVLLVEAGESPLDCPEGTESGCGPVTHFIDDTGPLVLVLLLGLAAGVVWAADRALSRWTRRT